MNKKIRKLLYRSFEDELNEEERKLLEGALARSAELRREKEGISEQRLLLADLASSRFKPFFAERVMNRIFSATDTANGFEFFYQNLKAAFSRLVIAGALTLLILFTLNLAIGDSLSSEDVFFASDSTYEEIRQLPLF